MNTQSDFISVKKSDVNFKNFLMGNLPQYLSDDLKGEVRAIPIHSLNVGLVDEVVTFKMQPIAEILQPGFFLFLSRLVKIKSYLLILVPLFFVIVNNVKANTLSDPLSLTIAVVAIIFIYAGLNIRNDIADHVSGYDRVNPPVILKPIQAGWITAKTSAFYSWIAIGCGIFIGFPVFILQPKTFYMLIAILPLIFIGQFYKKNMYKEKVIGEFILFLLMGVGITAGFQTAVGAAVDAQVIAFGIFWGTVVLFLVHINNFSHLLTSTQAGVVSTITKLGFDPAKVFLVLWWGFCLFLWATYHWLYAPGSGKWLGIVVLVVYSFPFFKKILQIKSPLGSGLIEVHQYAYKVFLMMVSVFFLEHLWFLWN